MDGGAWWAAVHEVAKSQTWLSDFTFAFQSHALEKEMATHSSVLAWRIPGMGEPCWEAVYGVAQSGHDWSDLAAAGTEKNNRKERFSLIASGSLVPENRDREDREEEAPNQLSINSEAHSWSHWVCGWDVARFFTGPVSNQILVPGISGKSLRQSITYYSHEIKRRLLLGRKVMINLDSTLKSRTLLCPQRSV